MSHRRNQIESDATQLCLIGIAVAVVLSVIVVTLFISEDSIFWTSPGPFVFSGVIALIWWGWYSGRIIKIVAGRVITKGKR
jgi:hypothetical protein